MKFMNIKCDRRIQKNTRISIQSEKLGNTLMLKENFQVLARLLSLRFVRKQDSRNWQSLEPCVG